MKNLLQIIVLALACCAAVSCLQNDSQRQGRSVASSSQSNMIDQHGPVSKTKFDAERRQVQEFMSPKNLFKSIAKLIFGNQDEIAATSRNFITMFGKILEIAKNSFGHRSRSSGGRGSMRDWAEEAASAGVTMLQGYVKSVLSTDTTCIQKHLCLASKEAVTTNRDLGYLVSSVGGYVTSYLLENKQQPQGPNFKVFHDAVAKGRQNSDCAALYKCEEQNEV